VSSHNAREVIACRTGKEKMRCYWGPLPTNPKENKRGARGVLAIGPVSKKTPLKEKTSLSGRNHDPANCWPGQPRRNSPPYLFKTCSKSATSPVKIAPQLQNIIQEEVDSRWVITNVRGPVLESGSRPNISIKQNMIKLEKDGGEQEEPSEKQVHWTCCTTRPWGLAKPGRNDGYSS